jgi:methyl-accepting chemotaxis protein
MVAATNATSDDLARLPRLPIGSQIVVGVGTLLALLTISVLVAVVLIVDLRGDAASFADRQVRYAGAIDLAALNAKAIANHERGFLISGNPEFIAEIEIGTGQARAAFVRAEDAASGDAELKAVNDSWSGFERWLTAVHTEIDTYQSGQRRSAVATSLGRTRALRKTYEQSLARAQVLGSNAIQSAETSVSDASLRSVAILVVYLLFALALAIAVIVWVLRSVLQRVYSMMMQTLAAGETLETTP